MDPIFSLEYNKLLHSIDDIRRSIDATREVGSDDRELKGRASSDALEHCHQRLRTIYLERLREAARDKESFKLAAALKDLAGPSETAPSPDVCDKAELDCNPSPGSASLEVNHRQRVPPGGSIERGVSWKGNLEAVCIIPARVCIIPGHDADVQKSTFTKRGLELVGTLRTFRSKLSLTTTPVSNAMESFESAAGARRSLESAAAARRSSESAASRSGAKRAIRDTTRRRQSTG